MENFDKIMVLQLVSYIAPGAPATRKEARGDELFLRPEIGFTPNWYHMRLGIDFGRRWHCDPSYRLETRVQMAKELKKTFPGIPIGLLDDTEVPDVLTGAFGVLLIPAIYGAPLQFYANDWPDCKPILASVQDVLRLEPPDLQSNAFFCEFMEQLEWINRKVGVVKGFIVGQGVLNNAFRLRGEKIFRDVIKDPNAAQHLFECIATTIIEVAKTVHDFQAKTGFNVRFFTISNCLVNMVSPQTYRDLLFPYDFKISECFAAIGIHNCAWNATPYLSFYSTIPNVGYIDMGIESDLDLARQLFPKARRAVMYRPTDIYSKSLSELKKEFEEIARRLGPCDLVLADLDLNVPDKKIKEIYQLCMEISEKYENSTQWTQNRSLGQ